MTQSSFNSIIAKTLVTSTFVFFFAYTNNCLAIEANEKSTIFNKQNKSSNFELEIHLATGFLNGDAHEFVYWPEQGNHKASELIWKLDNVFMIGAGGSFRPTSWLTFNMEGWAIAGEGEGEMDDYDWLEPGLDWTDWSHHDDVKVTKGSIVDFNAQVAVWTNQILTLNTFLGFITENYEWEARGGTYTYSENGFRDSTGTFTDGQLGITYEQTLNVPYVGLGISADLNPVTLQSRIIGSSLVNGEAIDQHHLRSLIVYDDFSGGNMISFEAIVGITLSPNFSVGGGFYYTQYDTVTGDSEWHFSDGSIVEAPDGAGMSLEHSMLLITLLYVF